jgi:hypothetical protein
MEEHLCDRALPPGQCPACAGKPRPFVTVVGWHGSERVEVEVLGRTPKRTRIRFLADCAKGKAGDVRLVRPDAVHAAGSYEQPFEGLSETGHDHQ